MEKLNQTFFYSLEKAIKTYRQYFQNQLKLYGFDITLDQWLVLNMIVDYPDSTQMEIGERVFKDKASITRIIGLLIQNNYLTKEAHPSHGLMSRFVLTKKGSRTIDKLTNLAKTFRRNALKDIDPLFLKNTQSVMNSIIINCDIKVSKMINDE
jgi:MarR family transcriptional regulator, transcriptional regulator for hemolysin